MPKSFTVLSWRNLPPLDRFPLEAISCSGARDCQRIRLSCARLPRILPVAWRVEIPPGLSLNAALVPHLTSTPVLITQYAVKVGDFQGVRIPSGQSVARPEAIRVMEDPAACVNKS